MSLEPMTWDFACLTWYFNMINESLRYEHSAENGYNATCLSTIGVKLTEQAESETRMPGKVADD